MSGNEPAVTVHESRRRILLQLPLSDGSVALKELSSGDADRLQRALQGAAAHVRHLALETS